MFRTLDKQLARYSRQFESDLGLPVAVGHCFASSVADDLRRLGADLQKLLSDDDPINFKMRCEELAAFEGFMDATHSANNEPMIARARVLVQNYFCFVYVKDAWMERLRDVAPSSSPLSICTTFLTTGKVRSFRNAVSHAKWRHLQDFSGIAYWDRASGNRKAPLLAFGVEQWELEFWQELTRAVCYVTMRIGLNGNLVGDSGRQISG